MSKVKDEETDEEKKVLTGYFLVNLFRVEDTAGEPLEYQNIQLPSLPLLDVARAWGISVPGIPGNYSYYGSYDRTSQEISLATPEESVFFHELMPPTAGPWT